MSLFTEAGYELQNVWTPTGKSEKISSQNKALILKGVIKDHVLEDGNVIKNIIFLMKDASQKPLSFKLSPYNEQFPAGTRVNIDSVELSEYQNQEGTTRVTATCEMA